MAEWQHDVLGEGFEQLTLHLDADEEGPVVATLVRSLPPQRSFWQRSFTKPPVFSQVDILYVHGWSDYFFQTQLAEFWTSRGARFYAIDLRKYGRSLLEGQTPGFIDDLATYDEEINLAITHITGDQRKLVMVGHSTGGLTVSLWADRHPGVASAIILNSPWLEFQLSGTVRKLLAPLIEWGAYRDALEVAPQVDHGFYTRAQLEVATEQSPLHVNEAWRPAMMMPVRTGWMHAIINAQDKISSGGVSIATPVCVLLSERSIAPTRWVDDLKHVDSVLNVSAVAQAALQLGPSVTIERIRGALHDIFLSAPYPRADAYYRLERWMRGMLAGTQTASFKLPTESK